MENVHPTNGNVLNLVNDPPCSHKCRSQEISNLNDLRRCRSRVEFSLNSCPVPNISARRILSQVLRGFPTLKSGGNCVITESSILSPLVPNESQTLIF